MATIKYWPKHERPREKLLAQGSAALSDAELLAIFLRTGRPGKTALDMGRELLTQTGGLRGLFALGQEALCALSGIGEAKYAQLQAILELGQRYVFESLRRTDVLGNTGETKRYMIAKLSGYAHEVFACLFLDGQFRALSFVELFRGNVNRASVYPGEVAKQALQRHAAAVIVAHNHPSGNAEPSQSDERLTKLLKEALSLVDVALVDHIVVGGNHAVSLAERGCV